MENKLAVLFGVLTFLYLYSDKPSQSVCVGSHFSIEMYSHSMESDTIYETCGVGKEEFMSQPVLTR